jgi:hypothetical protein
VLIGVRTRVSAKSETTELGEGKKVINKSTDPVEAVTCMNRLTIGKYAVRALVEWALPLLDMEEPEEEMQGASVAGPDVYALCVGVSVRVGQISLSLT